MDEATARKELQKKVHLQVFQRFEYEVLDKKAGLAIFLPHENEA